MALKYREIEINSQLMSGKFQIIFFIAMILKKLVLLLRLFYGV